MSPIRGRYDTVDCPQCGRELVIKDHLKKPAAGVSAHRLHRVFKENIGSTFTIFCPACKHYSTFSEEAG